MSWPCALLSRSLDLESWGAATGATGDRMKMRSQRREHPAGTLTLKQDCLPLLLRPGLAHCGRPEACSVHRLLPLRTS